jgi:deoxyadenosine/deoxycytidine kinase
MKSGTDVLKLFYEEKERWAFSFENLVQLSRLKSHYECNKILSKTREFQANNKCDIRMKIFMERSIMSSFNVFTLNSYEEKGLNKVEFDILNRYFSLFKNELTANTHNSNLDNVTYKIIYIRTSPEITFGRLKMRNRDSENTIDLGYLMKIHQKYENWIENLSAQDRSVVKIVDGNLDKKQVISQIDKILQLE